MTREEYWQYLQTPHWKQFSRAVKDSVSGCQECGITDTLNVHHLHYRTLYRESADDVIVLCERCHMNTHIIDDRMKFFHINVEAKTMIEKRDKIQAHIKKLRGNSQYAGPVVKLHEPIVDFRNTVRGNSRFTQMIDASEAMDAGDKTAMDEAVKDMESKYER